MAVPSIPNAITYDVLKQFSDKDYEIVYSIFKPTNDKGRSPFIDNEVINFEISGASNMLMTNFSNICYSLLNIFC